MGNLYDTLTACLTDQLIQAVLSAAEKDGPSKVKIRAVLAKGLLFQTAAQVEKQQFHEVWKKKAKAISKRSRNGS